VPELSAFEVEMAIEKSKEKLPATLSNFGGID